MGKGSKQWLQDIINFYQINRNGYPYELIYKLTKLLNVLEDTYSVSTITELQEAIDYIGTGAGTIFIAAGTYDITTTIDIDNCGTLVIYGHGDNTIIKPNDGISAFNITCCDSLLMKTFKIDTSNYTANTQAVIVNEASDNVCAFQDMTIEGGGTNGIGIELVSNNCAIGNCTITNMAQGIYINNSNSHIITNNIINSHADYGLYADTSNYLNISTNTCGSNGNYGIYLDTITYSTFSGNICNNNTTGIYIDSCINNTITNNSCNSNSANGTYLTGSSYNTVSSNTLNSNDSNSVAATAGLYITTNSDYNTISGNTVNNNNNAGVGTGYGIYIASATCDENVIAANNANGNDVDYMDSGTATTVEYYVQNADELQDAIDSIASKAGIININSSITISTAIDIDGGGSYIVKGNGDNTTLIISGDISCFNITNARSVLLQNLKIDASGYTIAANTTEIINISEGSNNPVIVDNIIIIGDTTNKYGYGIGINSIYKVRIQNCYISYVNIAIRITGGYNFFENNRIFYCKTYGIYDTYGWNMITGNLIEYCGNIITGGDGAGIYSDGADHNNIVGNQIWNNYGDGIYMDDCDYWSITANSLANNDSLDAGTYGTIHLNDRCDYNAIEANTIRDNQNGGGGTTYGVYIETVDCNDNNIKGNIFALNQCNWKDNGARNEIEYICPSASQIQQAIDSIGAKSGIIKIVSEAITVSTTIDIDGGGDYVIEGDGASTILTLVGDTTCFAVTSAKSCVFRKFKIDANDLTVDNTNIISVDEISDNIILIDNVYITGDGTHGYGVYINSNNNIVRNSEFDNIHTGIMVWNGTNNTRVYGNYIHDLYVDGIIVLGDNSLISNNVITNNTWCYGIEIRGSNIVVIGNNITNGHTGIIMDNSYYCTIVGNVCSDNAANDDSSDNWGIKVDILCEYNIFIGNNCSNNTNVDGGHNGYGILISDFSGQYNLLSGNVTDGNDIDYLDNGTGTRLFGDDTAYAATWNGDLGTPTKNAVYDELQIILGTFGSYLPLAGGIMAGDIVMDTGAVITSADEDLTFLFGRNQLSSLVASQAFFGYRGHTDVQYGIKQTSTFGTYLNAATGKLISHRINNVDKMVMSASALTMRIPIAMGGNDITSTGDITISPLDGLYVDEPIVIGDANVSGNIMSYAGDTALILTGTTADFSVNIQDGTGRVLMYWNAYENASAHYYQVANEYAYGLIWTGGFWAFKVAPDTGAADGLITWSTILEVRYSVGIRMGGSGAWVTTILDEDNMATNSATALATQQSIKAYADLMLPLSGGTMTGDINMGGHDILSSGVVSIKPNGDTDDHWIISTASNATCMYAAGASTSSETGYIGYDIVSSTAAPLGGIFSYNFYKDAAGTYGNYDMVDDLDLLRKCHNSIENKIKPIDGLDYEITAYDMRSLPWLAAVPDIDKLSDDKLRYANDIAQPIGYLLSTMKKILLRQDELIEEIKDLKTRIASLEIKKI